MRIDKALKALLKFSQSTMDKGGKDIAAKHRAQFTQGKDHKGKNFKAYRPYYAQKKASGNAAKNQISTQTSPVNLVLTGDMVNAFDFISSTIDGTEVGFDYGITDNKQAQKMQDLADGKIGNKVIKSRKRIVASDQNLGPMVESALATLFVNQINGNLKKLTGRPTVINI